MSTAWQVPQLTSDRILQQLLNGVGHGQGCVPLPLLPHRMGKLFQEEGIALRPGQELLFQHRAEGHVVHYVAHHLPASIGPRGWRAIWVA